ncbi:unnamed protein product [Prunus brigantina]
MSTDSSVRGTSSGRATCTTIFRHLMIRRKRPKQIRAIGTRRLFSTIQEGSKSRRSTSLATFMFDLGMSWLSPFIRRWWRRDSWFFRSPPPNFLPILCSSLWILHMMQGFRS